MNKIRKAFENFWKIKSLNNDFKEEDKEKYYELFMDGYACALIDVKDSPKVKPIILDDNPLSLSKYAEEFPENFEELSESLPKKEIKKYVMKSLSDKSPKETQK